MRQHPKAHCTIKEFRTLPRVLADAGYVCGLCGKWHLGDNLKPQEGFTSRVTMPHGHTTTFHGAEVIEGGKVRKKPSHLTDFWTDHAVRFIEQNRDKPFFLFLACDTRPLHAFDETMHVPLIVRHPGAVPAGKTE